MKFIRRTINEGYFKNPQQLKDDKEKRQSSAAETIVKTTQKLIIPKLQSILNEIIKSTSPILKTNLNDLATGTAAFYGFNLNDNNHIDIYSFQNGSISFLRLHADDDFIIKPYFDNGIFHFSINTNLYISGLSKATRFIHLTLRNGGTTDIEQMYSSKKEVLNSLKKIFATNINEYYLAKFKDKEVVDLLKRYELTSPDNFEIDDIFVNFKDKDNNFVDAVVSIDVTSNGGAWRASGIDIAAIEETNKKILSVCLNVFAFSKNVTFKIGYLIDKNYTHDSTILSRAKNAVNRIPTFNGGIKFANKKYINSVNEIIVDAARLLFGSKKVVERVQEYFGNITPKLTYAIFNTLYYYTNTGELKESYNILKGIALQSYEPGTSKTSNIAIAKIGLDWTGQGFSYPGHPTVLDEINQYVYIAEPGGSTPNSISYSIHSWDFGKDSQQIVDALYKNIFEYLYDYTLKNGDIVYAQIKMFTEYE